MLSAARYDVAGIAERERLSFWQETVGSLFPPADIGLIGDRPFSGSISRRDLGTLAIADIRSVAQHVSRRPRHIDRNVEDVFEINFQLAGTGFVAQGGREAETAPGQFVMYDSARPYEMRFDGAFRQLTVKFPRSKLTDRLWVADRLTAVNFTWRDGPGRLVFDFMRTLGQLGLGGDPETVPRLQEHALDLLATTLRDADATRREAGSSHTRLATLRRAQTFIRDNLGDPDLSPRVVAEAAHIAIRTLYELFAIEVLHAWKMDSDDAAGRLPAGPRGPAAGIACDRRYRLRPGFQRRGAFQPAFPVAIWPVAACLVRRLSPAMSGSAAISK